MEAGRALSNHDLDAHFRGNKLYGGTLAKDRLPAKGPAGKFYVINIQSQEEGDRQGTHWVGLIDCAIPDTNEDYCLYYDPFAVAPPQDVLTFMSKSKKPAVWVTDQHQPIDSTACGWYVIRVIEGILKSVPYEQIFDGLLKEDRYEENEAYVRKLKLKKSNSQYNHNARISTTRQRFHGRA